MSNVITGGPATDETHPLLLAMREQLAAMSSDVAAGLIPTMDSVNGLNKIVSDFSAELVAANATAIACGLVPLNESIRSPSQVSALRVEAEMVLARGRTVAALALLDRAIHLTVVNGVPEPLSLGKLRSDWENWHRTLSDASPADAADLLPKFEASELSTQAAAILDRLDRPPFGPAESYVASQRLREWLDSELVSLIDNRCVIVADTGIAPPRPTLQPEPQLTTSAPALTSESATVASRTEPAEQQREQRRRKALEDALGRNAEVAGSFADWTNRDFRVATTDRTTENGLPFPVAVTSVYRKARDAKSDLAKHSVTKTDVEKINLASDVETLTDSISVSTAPELVPDTEQKAVLTPGAELPKPKDAYPQANVSAVVRAEPPALLVASEVGPDAGVLAEPEAAMAYGPACSDGPPELAQLREAATRFVGSGGVTEAAGLFWTLMAEQRPGLAFAVAAAPELQRLRAVAAAHLLGNAAETSADAREQLRDWLDRCAAADGQMTPPQQVALFGALIRPALLAPESNAFNDLQQMSLPPELTPLHELRKTLVDLVKSRPALSPKLLGGVHARDAWDSQMKSLEAAVVEIGEQGRQRKLRYAPATKLLHTWLGSTSKLGHALALVAGGRRDQQAAVEQACMLHEHHHLERKIEEHGIEGPVHHELLRLVQEVIELMRRWLKAAGQEPAVRERDFQMQVDVYRQQIIGSLKQLPTALHSWAENVRSSPAAARGAAVSTAARLEEIRLVFAGTSAEAINGGARPADALPPAALLYAELLGLPEIDVDGVLRPVLTDVDLAEQVGLALADGVPDPAAAFERRCERGDLRGAAWLRNCPGIARNIGDSDTQKRLDDLIEDGRHRTRSRIEQVRAEVERAASDDLLGEEDLSNLIQRLASYLNELEPERPELPDFHRIGNDLDLVSARVRQARTGRTAETRSLIDKSGVRGRDKSVAAAIDDALALDDVVTAREYLAVWESGESISAARAAKRVFDAYFPDFVDAAETYLGKTNIRAAANQLQLTGKAGPIDASAATKGVVHGGAELLRAWSDLKAAQKRGIDAMREPLQALLTHLGLSVRSLTPGDAGAIGTEFRVAAVPIADRDLIPLPQVGSSAKGLYRVICFPDQVSTDDLITYATNAADHQAVLAVRLGSLTASSRRDLADRCRRSRKSFLLLDETLALFLAGHSGSRLAALAQCALPFTVFNPYESSSAVPPEMFYGRDLQRQSIFAPNGSSLVYGGRQLGKTALLRDVERRYHDPAHGIIVKWVDLRDKGIGLSRPAGDVWQVLVEELAALGVVPATVKSESAFRKSIVAWLGGAPGRRILLLLDEADRFLDSDRTKHQYQAVTQLKGLMDTTGRAFKVVFAGLHNVQRSYRDANTPLALHHMGEALCIGPLLGNGEARQALDLVCRPFEALGYRFESPRLLWRILSHTNYYPSLIQIFCNRLLNALTQSSRTSLSPSGGPPFLVTAGDLDKAYNDDNLRDRIRERFELTLNLDTRYRFLALAIGCENLADPVAAVAGFTVDQIRQNVVDWSAKSFDTDRSREAVRDILDEMVGLGVLRRVPRPDGIESWGLRSPNVLNLLGSQADILERLGEAAEKPTLAGYDPASFRRTLGDASLAARTPPPRSPLTNADEARLTARRHTVGVIAGSELAGLDLLPQALAGLVGPSRAVTLRDVTPASAHELVEMLEGVWQERPDEATVSDSVWIVYVGAAVPWTAQWVHLAQGFVSLRRSSVRYLKVIFVADPLRAWELQQTWAEQGPADVERMWLGRWAESMTRECCELAECGEPEMRRLSHESGGWCQLIHRTQLRDLEGAARVRQQTLAHAAAWQDREVPAAALPVLRAMVQYGSALPLGEIEDLVDPRTSSVRTFDILRWASALGFVTAEPNWQPDPLVAELIEAADSRTT